MRLASLLVLLTACSLESAPETSSSAHKGSPVAAVEALQARTAALETALAASSARIEALEEEVRDQRVELLALTAKVTDSPCVTMEEVEARLAPTEKQVEKEEQETEAIKQWIADTPFLSMEDLEKRISTTEATWAAGQATQDKRLSAVEARAGACVADLGEVRSLLDRTSAYAHDVGLLAESLYTGDDALEERAERVIQANASR